MEKAKQQKTMQVSKHNKNNPGNHSHKKSTSGNSLRARLIEKPDYYDYSLVAAIILLTCFGLIMLYSTSAYTSTLRFGDDMYFFKKQAAISFVCIAGAMFISLFDYHILARFTGVLYAMAAASMILVRTPLGFQRSQKMAEDRTDSVSAGRDRQDRCDRLSFLYGRSYGEENEFTQGLYDTWRAGYLSCNAGICLYR